MNDYYVYAYLREDGTPYYIGKGKDNRAYQKRNFKPPSKDRIIIILDNLTEEQAFANEIDYIKWYGRKDNNTGSLRNLTDGGEGASGMILSEETKKRISIAKTNPSDETRKRLRESHLGHKPSEETNKKRSESIRKFYEDNLEARKKISDVHRGKPKSEEQRRKQSEYMKENNLGARLNSAESIRKRAETHKGMNWITNGINNRKIRKPEEPPEGWYWGKARFKLKKIRKSSVTGPRKNLGNSNT